MSGYADWGDAIYTDWGDSPPNAQEKRETVASLIRSVLADAWTVYDAPPPIVTIPSVIVAPEGAYRTLTTFDKEGVTLALRIVVQPGDDALDTIDAVMDVLARGAEPLLDIPSVTRLEVAGIQPATLANGGDVLVGSINLTVS